MQEIAQITSLAIKKFTNPHSKKLEGVHIIDGICGSGKTHSAIELCAEILTKNKSARIVYAAPYLDELHRFAGTIRNPKSKTGKPKRDKNRKIIRTEHPLREFKFIHAESKDSTKLEDFKSLLIKGRNVVITHALFIMIDEEARILLKSRNYHLIIDEEPTVIDLANNHFQSPLYSSEIISFVQDGLLSINKTTGLVSWNSNGGKRAYIRYNDVKAQCDQNNIFLYFENKENPILIWRLNFEIFKCFKTVRVLTYLAKGSVFTSYLSMNNIPYVIDDATSEGMINNERVKDYHNKIHLYLPRGTAKNIILSEYSVSWYRNLLKEQNIEIKRRLSSYFKSANPFNPSSSSSTEKLWTSFIESKDILSGAGYTKNFIPFNARATNNYSCCNKVAFMINHYPVPPVVNYLQSCGSPVNRDSIALSVLLQFIFRSALRDGREIHLYIPSDRMRKLLTNWMASYKETWEFIKEVINQKQHLIQSEVTTPSRNLQVDIVKHQPGLINYIDLVK